MSYTEKFKVTSHDVDHKNIIKPSILLRYMQECANHQMRDCKPSYTDLVNDGKAMIILRMVMKMLRPIHQYDEITVTTWHCNDKGLACNRCYEIYIGNEKVAYGTGLWALVDINTKSIIRMEEVDFSSYGIGEPIENEGLRFRMPKEEFEHVGTHTVMYSETDINRHLNNTVYPDMLYNYIPDIENHYVTEMSITYKKEAPQGCTLDITRSSLQNDDTYYFRSLVDGDTNVDAYFKIKESLDY